MAPTLCRGGIVLALWVGCAATVPALQAEEGGELAPIPSIPRRIPPPGGEPAAAVREALEPRVRELRERVWEIDYESHAADAGALVKAVDFALRHGEFYDEKTAEVANVMLDLAERRHREIAREDTRSWTERRGRVVRGYRSRIDDSYQPFGLEIPEELDLSEPVPLLVWLHGRGDERTDLRFLERCRTKSQAFGGMVADQQECIVLYPFGRHCVGWKHAGEIDVFEAIEQVMADYPVDPDRIALAGFSMGGAGAWHIGAHYRDRFCAVHAGAGFAETAEYNRMQPEDYPPERIRTLWQVYDAPDYVRNFLNGPVLAYSGEEDKQKQAADLMARELAEVGHELRHVVGEGMGHRYDQASVDEIWAWLREAWERGRPERPATVRWQTPTLRYPGYDWLQLRGLDSHWERALATAEWDDEAGHFHLELENVSAVEIAPGPGADLAGSRVTVEGTTLEVRDPGFAVEALELVRRGGQWRWGEPAVWRKRPGMQGPIDDAFLGRFVVVPPGSPPASPRVARWVDFELDHFRDRWSALMRGEVIQKQADELDSDDIAGANLVLWGDPGSNAMIAEILDRLPIEWDEESFTFRGHTLDAGAHVPVFIHPNPLNPDRYVVINSGLTFREGHDRTNSQQNPKLPDWAIVGLDQLPDETLPGRIVDAGFFDESWE